MAHWLKPPVVTAPDPVDRSKTINLAFSDEFFAKHSGVFRRSPIFQIWTHVVGQLPPINNISRLMRGELVPTISTLADSVACFQGVKRPYIDEENGDSVVVYVLNPRVTIDYEPDLACPAKGVRLARTTVATVQVRPTKSLQISGVNIWGTVTRLEFVRGEGGEPNLPVKHSDRYVQRLWR
jgi:hypothetical protein